MAKLIYSTIASLDGYVEDKDGNFGWARPGAEVHAFINDLQRPIGTHLEGRRMYETMAVWDDDEMLTAPDDYVRDFAQIWQAADKIVFSRTLDRASTARTRIERDFDPDAIRRLRATSDRDISVGGPDLAAQAFRAGLIDECQLFVVPILVGAGKDSLPRDLRLELALLDERRFDGGFVYLRYATKPEPA